MAALQPHHLDQFAARHEGLRYSLATGKLPRLNTERRARLIGRSAEQIRARRWNDAVTAVGIIGFVIFAGAATVCIQAVL